jgi:hypothetical protein
MRCRTRLQSKDTISCINQGLANRRRITAHAAQCEIVCFHPKRRPVPRKYFPCAGDDQSFRALNVDLDEINSSPSRSRYHAVKSIRVHIDARRCELMISRMIEVYFKLRDAFTVRHNAGQDFDNPLRDEMIKTFPQSAKIELLAFDRQHPTGWPNLMRNTLREESDVRSDINHGAPVWDPLKERICFWRLPPALVRIIRQLERRASQSRFQRAGPTDMPIEVHKESLVAGTQFGALHVAVKSGMKVAAGRRRGATRRVSFAGLRDHAGEPKGSACHLWDVSMIRTSLVVPCTTPLSGSAILGRAAGKEHSPDDFEVIAAQSHQLPRKTQRVERLAHAPA